MSGGNDGAAAPAARLLAGAAAAAAAAKCASWCLDSWVLARPFDPVEAALDAFRAGKGVVVMDDEDRENEGDIIAPAHSMTEALASLMVNHTTGILCAPMPEARADALNLSPMLSQNEDPKGTAFTVTCDARHGVTTGVSSADRCATFRALADPASGAGDLSRPGHVFPLRAKPGGVLTRRGHTEATVDLCQLAGVEPPVGVIGELVKPDGGMMRRDDCKRFAYRNGMPIITIDALAKYLTARTLTLRSPSGELLSDAEVLARPFDAVDAAVAAMRAGRGVVVMDDEDRENEGDIIAAAGGITEELVTVIVNHTTGILCAPMPGPRADALQLAPMLSRNEDPKGTAFTVTCDARRGVTTGVSSADRAATFHALADGATGPEDLSRPGHVFPLRARIGGVLTRRGHTEATVDLCQLAQLDPPVGVIGELVRPDGKMMRRDDCKRFAFRNGMPIITIDALADVLRERKAAAEGPPPQYPLPVAARRVGDAAGPADVRRRVTAAPIGIRTHSALSEAPGLTPSPSPWVAAEKDDHDSFGSDVSASPEMTP